MLLNSTPYFIFGISFSDEISQLAGGKPHATKRPPLKELVEAYIKKEKEKGATSARRKA